MQEAESSPAPNECVTAIISEKGWGRREDRRWVVLGTMMETRAIENAVQLACLGVLVSARLS